MATRLHNFSYDVAIKPVKMNVVEESKHEYAEDGKITVSTCVNVSDTVDVKQTINKEVKSMACGKKRKK